MRLHTVLGILLAAAWPAASMADSHPQPPLDRALQDCAAIQAGQQRLRCFDALASHRRAGSVEHASVAPAATPVTAISAAAATPGVAPAVPSLQPARGIGFRLAAGYGFNIGDNTGSFHGRWGKLNLQSAVGSSGPMVSGQAWVDRLLGPNWTIGLEYVAIRNEGKLSATLPKGMMMLPGPMAVGGRVKVRADMGFLNVAYRPSQGTIHPFVGAGLGVGYGHASAWYDFENRFMGTLAEASAYGKTIAGVQGFTGVDFDLGRHAYIGIMPKVIVVDTHPIGIDQRYIVFGVTGTFGLRF